MIKLNLGCGNKLLDGYINIDVRKTHESVMIADVRKLPYEPGTIDEIRAVDVYEHISWRESEKVLKHWVDLLKPGGTLIIQTTNLLAIFTLWKDGKIDTKTAIARLFGGQNYKENFHYTVGNFDVLIDYLEKAGIKHQNIRYETGFGNHTNLRITAIK